MFKKTILMATVAFTLSGGVALAQSPSDLNDFEIAHVAYTADNIDIRYAHLALAKSQNQAIKEFAETMIRDHTAVNNQALALLQKLEAAPQDNFLSRQLNAQAEKIVAELSALNGADFDRRYAENELGYHQAVNGLVSGSFIPNIENSEVKALFIQGLAIFKAHENHAEKMMKTLNKMMN